MTNISSSLEISIGIDEESQMANFQNATLHGVTESIACSIAVFPKYPDKIQSEEQVRAYLTKALAPLIAEGWKFEVQIGSSLQEPENYIDEDDSGDVWNEHFNS